MKVHKPTATPTRSETPPIDLSPGQFIYVSGIGSAKWYGYVTNVTEMFPSGEEGCLLFIPGIPAWRLIKALHLTYEQKEEGRIP